MTSAGTANSRRSAWWNYLFFPPLVFASVLFERLNALEVAYHSHPIWMVPAFALLIGLLLGLAAALSSFFENGAARAVTVLLSLLVLALAVDLALDGRLLLANVTSFANEWPDAARQVVKVFVVGAAGLAFFLVFWLLDRNLPLILFVFSVAIFTTSIAKPALEFEQPTSIGGARSDAPATVFIVLDEMIGIGGLDPSLPGSARIRDVLKYVFDKYGLRYFERAYSRHWWSEVSIPAMLNFNVSDDGNQGAGAPSRLSNIEAFDLAAQRGDKVQVFQTSHIDFCQSQAVSACETFPSFNASSEYVEDTFSPHERMAALLTLLEGSYTVGWMSDALAPLPPMPERFELNGLTNWVDHVGDAIKEEGRGTFSFVHLLAPHAPYILDPRCVVQPRWGHGYYLTEVRNLVGDELDSARAANYDLYYQQSECVLKLLDGMLAKILSDARFEDATVVISGDHGSRISAGQGADVMQLRDYIDGYSTSFAVRRPDILPGPDTRAASVQRLVSEFVGGIGYGDDEGTLIVMANGHNEVRPRPFFLSTN